MNTYRITYRTARGNTETVSLSATSASQASSLFTARYDGRIITIDEA